MSVADELRERLKLKYMGDCKCGDCQLVPSDLISRAAAELDGMIKALKAVEEWWLKEEMQKRTGAPYAIFAARAAVANASNENPKA